MKCHLCESKMRIFKDPYPHESKIIGTVYVPNIKQEICDSCEEIFLPPGEAQKIIEYVRSKEQKAISRLPISSFISSREATKVLGISRQALSKSHDVKSGIIISTSIDRRRFYYRESIHQYKKTRDGRMLLPEYKSYQASETAKIEEENVYEDWNTASDGSFHVGVIVVLNPDQQTTRVSYEQ